MGPGCSWVVVTKGWLLVLQQGNDSIVPDTQPPRRGRGGSPWDDKVVQELLLARGSENDSKRPSLSLPGRPSPALCKWDVWPRSGSRTSCADRTRV